MYILCSRHTETLQKQASKTAGCVGTIPCMLNVSHCKMLRWIWLSLALDLRFFELLCLSTHCCSRSLWGFSGHSWGIFEFYLEKSIVTTIHEDFFEFETPLTADLEKSKKHDQIVHLRKIIWKSVVLKPEHLENGGNPNFGFQQVTHIPPTSSSAVVTGSDFLFVLNFFSILFFLQEWSLTKSYPTIHCPNLFLTTLFSYSREEAHHKLARSHTNPRSFIHYSYFREEAWWNQAP